MNANDDTTPAGGFVGRWSARKRAAATGTASDSAPTATPTDDVLGDNVLGPDPVEPMVVVDKAEASTDDRADESAASEPVLSDADMPPIDSLDANSDVSDFFNSGVSAALRRAALRHVFRSPRYNLRDGLNDYDGDYTVFEPLGDTVTSDMKFHAARKLRMAEEAERERVEAERLAKREADAADERAEVEQPDAQPADAQSDGPDRQPNDEPDNPTAPRQDRDVAPTTPDPDPASPVHADASPLSPEPTDDTTRT